MAFLITGIASDGATFDVGPYHNTFEDAEEYARGYARSVSHTDRVITPKPGMIIASGPDYWESLEVIGDPMSDQNPTTVWDLAGAWPDGLEAFRLGRSSIEWEDAQATAGECVRIARLVVTPDGIRQVNRYVGAETVVAALIFEGGEAR